MMVNARDFAIATKESLLYYSQFEGGWTTVALFTKSDEFSVDSTENFIDVCEGTNEISIVAFQTFLPGATQFDIQLNEIKKSKARVILTFLSSEYALVLQEADKFGLVGDNYVWYVPSTAVAIPMVGNELARGTIGSNIFIPYDTQEYFQFVDIWNSADPSVYKYAGGAFNSFQLLSYDLGLVVGYAVQALEQEMPSSIDLSNAAFDIPAEIWANAVANLNFPGTTGNVTFTQGLDRIGEVEFLYYSPEGGWLRSAKFSENAEQEYTVIHDVVWHSNSTKIPDLDIRPPFDYWSCHDKEKKHDKTGKTITLHTPDGSDIDEIDYDYYCDSFIDCKNFSDESVDCSTNYLIVFIVFGIITGLLILLSFALIIYVFIFGIILKYRRLKQRSPIFLIILLISMIIGYSSIYAWFGKPNSVACGFQPWLLGLSTISMISSLSVKNFRIWRIFRFPLSKMRISDLELIFYWIITMIPAVIIIAIWTIVSTPTAKMKDRDGDDHFVCTTGGFTGEPGGLVFFFIFVGYAAFILLFGAFISFLSRNVPNRYNESKLLTISIYNLGFLSVVIIPVFLVIQGINPFAAWIIRTSAILYAFTATMILQFFPIIWAITFFDKCRNVKVFKSNISSSKEPGGKGGSDSSPPPGSFSAPSSINSSN